MREDVPPHMRNKVNQIETIAAEMDTRLARAKELPVPELEPVDPKIVAEHAQSPDAPHQLKMVARAVAEGRTTWTEVASGGGLDLPEVRDLRDYGLVQLERDTEQYLADEAAGRLGPDGRPLEQPEPPATPAEPAPPARSARPPRDDDDDDFSGMTFLR
ncbi:hypothetical protein EV191_1011406 [Tamaricihabitans halophyticus]|uniref:Uncharacterized protein n=1 Tax=Tamaricihabitans halophyticus TaxID=1262583 RepID=A0A4R2RCJ5_9PSEU|nr:hypothetical protein [Tamaricihabitans halophyticus]TCP57451.1 hypothetical protein EV191_1011406 [Tamaricihabitans halophyticus]